MNTKTFKVSDAHRLDDPERLKWLPPDEAIQMLSLEPGMTGYFSLPFARAIAPEGRVLAVDLQPEMLGELSASLHDSSQPWLVRSVVGPARARRTDDGHQSAG